jgi:hypothetical protein
MVDAPGVELRSAPRVLWATPVVTLVVILSLALAIGANTAMFSLVDNLLLRALPVQQAERLVSVEPSDLSATWSYPLRLLRPARRQADDRPDIHRRRRSWRAAADSSRGGRARHRWRRGWVDPGTARVAH